MAPSGSFYQLPDELLLRIFSYLDIPDLVLNIQHVDSHWKAIVQDNSFWRDYVFTIDRQMADQEIILLLKSLPVLRALVATRPTITKVIHTLCETNKFITRLELHRDHKFTVLHLETIAKNLPHIQHLAFPLLGSGTETTMKYSTLIQQFHQLLSLSFLGHGYDTENCFFLKGIACECPLLQEIDLGGHQFQIEDTILFLETKKKVISKFFAQGINSPQIIRLLGACKQLQALHFEYCGETLSNISKLDLPNLKHLGITQYSQQHLTIIVRTLVKTTMSNLQKLDLGSCTFDAGLFEHILVNCVDLKTLILQFCSLPNGNDFWHIAKCIHLEYLDVHNTMITDVAVETFTEKCRKLKHLDINDSPMITEFGLQCLLKCTELRTLKLNGTQINGQNFHLIPLRLTKLCELHVEYCHQLDFQSLQQLHDQIPHLQLHASRELTLPEDFVDLAETSLFTELC